MPQKGLHAGGQAGGGSKTTGVVARVMCGKMRIESQVLVAVGQVSGGRLERKGPTNSEVFAEDQPTPKDW